MIDQDNFDEKLDIIIFVHLSNLSKQSDPGAYWQSLQRGFFYGLGKNIQSEPTNYAFVKTV